MCRSRTDILDFLRCNYKNDQATFIFCIHAKNGIKTNVRNSNIFNRNFRLFSNNFDERLPDDSRLRRKSLIRKIDTNSRIKQYVVGGEKIHPFQSKQSQTEVYRIYPENTCDTRSTTFYSSAILIPRMIEYVPLK